MATSCTADRACRTASAIPSTLPACCWTATAGNCIPSPATVIPRLVVRGITRRFRESFSVRMDHRAAGLGIDADGVPHLIGDLRRQLCLCPADQHHDLATQLGTGQPPRTVVDVEA